MDRSSPARSRVVALSGQDNFRDLGGDATADGRRVRWGRLFRSGELTALDDRDLEVVAALGIRTVVDLRGTDEAAAKGPDRLPPGASPVSIPIEPGDLHPVLGPAFSAGDLSNVYRHEQAAASLDGLRDAVAHQRGVHRDEIDTTNVRGLFCVDAAYLEAVRDEIVAHDGSMEGFIRRTVGLTGAEVRALHDALLE